MRSALLLGNGINRAVDNNGWRDLLRDLAQKYACTLPESATVANLPLEFERIYSAAIKKNPEITEEDIIEDIQEYMPNIDDFTLWKKFTALPVRHIMTANYEYNIEKALASPDFSAGANREDRSEKKKFSLFRRIIVNDKRVWHIHGEACRKHSICLGYDFYCRYLAQIQKFAKRWKKYPEKDAESWVTVFLTRNVHIAGLSLSFIEIDLWWLLSFWVRMGDRPQRGRIHYYYPERPRGEGKAFDEQLHLMESFGVELHPVRLYRDKWKDFYSDVAEAIKTRL